MAANRIRITSASAGIVDTKRRPVGEVIAVGTCLDALSISKDASELPWYRFKLPSGRDAYISDNDAKLREEAELLAPGIVYEKKDASSRVLFELKPGARFGIWSRPGAFTVEGWMEVEYENQTGFMSDRAKFKVWLPVVKKHGAATANIIYAIVAFGPLAVLLWKKELNVVVCFGWIFLTRMAYNKLTE